MSSSSHVRVLVVDDSAFMRKMLGEILRNVGMEVVATANDGQDALEKARRLKPDVITADVEMPRMDGVEFLRELMREDPIPVVVISSQTAEGADATIQCLELGAYDCLHKPSGSISLDIDLIGADIVAKVLAAANSNVLQLKTLVAPDAGKPIAGSSIRKPSAGGAGSGREPIVVIASSTGGPAALQEVIPRLPGDLPAAVVLIQHLPVGFTEPLAKRLDASSAFSVREAKEGDAPQVGMVLVAPAGKHLSFDTQGLVTLNEDPPLWGVRPAADVTLRTAAERFGSRVAAVILTGMGKDGALGAKAVRQAGGTCLAQNEETCVVFGMPRAAHEAGAVDQLLPLSEIAGAIVTAVEKQAGVKAAKAA